MSKKRGLQLPHKRILTSHNREEMAIIYIFSVKNKRILLKSVLKYLVFLNKN